MPRAKTTPVQSPPSAPRSIVTTIENSKAILTPAELAAFLNVSVKSIYAWTKAGTLPAAMLGASIRFDPVPTAEWLRKRIA